MTKRLDRARRGLLPLVVGYLVTGVTLAALVEYLSH